MPVFSLPKCLFFKIYGISILNGDKIIGFHLDLVVCFFFFTKFFFNDVNCAILTQFKWCSKLQCRWAMSSLTLKGKPSEQASLAPVNTSAPISSTASNASSGMHRYHFPFRILLNFWRRNLLYA